MNQSGSEGSIVRDEGSDPDLQSQHERRVEEAEEQATGEPLSPTPGGSANRYTGSGAEPYEDEVEAEREGTTADEVDGDDNDTPPEAARIYTG